METAYIMRRPNHPTSFERLEDRRLFAASTVPSQLGGAERASLDLVNNWKFIKDPTNDIAGENPTTSTSSWSTVSLPNTYNATDGANGDGTAAGVDKNGNPVTSTVSGGNYYIGSTWYRNSFTPSKSWETRRMYLDVEAASIKADVYVNGEFVGEHLGGYAGFTFDITNYVNKGQSNTISIKVDNAVDNNIPGYQGDFTKFGGLTRGVQIFATNKLHVNSANSGASGIKVTQTTVSSASATLDISAGLRNDNTRTLALTLKSSLVDASGKVVKTVSQNLSMTKHKSQTLHQTISLTNPHLWNGVSDPYLYTAYVQLVSGGNVLDTLSAKIGLRSFTMDSNAAYLNGKKTQLRGANLHDDIEGSGNATTYAQKLADMTALKNMGSNAVRFAHWQVDQDYYDIADMLGLMVWTEVPLWGNHVTQTQAFTDNAVQQMQEMIRQNYNHPSIVYWGLFNELPKGSETGGAAALSIAQTMQATAKAEDPRRYTIAASSKNGSDPINNVADVTVFNEYYGWYNGTPSDLTNFISTQKAVDTSMPIGLGEYGAGANPDQHVNDPTSGAPSGDPNSDQTQPEEYQTYLHEQSWQAIKNSPTYVFAAFIWEYADNANDDRLEGSEPGLNTKGIVSYDRQTKKDAYYYYQTQWSRTPTLWLTSKDYTDRTDASTTVTAFTNLGTSAELFINGHSKGTATPVNGVLTWNVTLDSGTNGITVRSTASGKTYTQTATWNLGIGAHASSYVATTAAVATPETKKSVASDLFSSEATIV